MLRLFASAVVALVAHSASAQTPTCKQLEGKARVRATDLITSEFVYDCCDDTIARCLKRKRVCRLAYRLSENICRRAKAGQSADQIRRALTRRASSMMATGKKATFELLHAPMAGDSKAPVVVVEYACARCPFCGTISPPLHDAVVTGPLKDKARVYFRPFPIRNHQHSKDANLCLMAAIRLGRFWPFMKLLFEHFDDFSVDNAKKWARQSGMDPKQFIAMTQHKVTRELLIASKKEGLRNKITATPTFFINGRKYEGEHRLAELIDVFEEEYERVTGRRYRD